LYTTIIMENTGTLDIRVTGENNGMPISPQNYDVREIMNILSNIEHILYPNMKDRPIISYEIKEGSFIHRFKTATQAIISSTAIFSAVQQRHSLDFLDAKTAAAIEEIQQAAYKKNYIFEITSSESDQKLLEITPQTNYKKSETYFIDTELYLYGEITYAGGKMKSTIHLDTEEFGSLTVQTPKEIIQRLEENPIYKECGLRVAAWQNMETGEFDRTNLHFIEMIEYNNSFDKGYLDDCIGRAKDSWADIKDTDEWLREMRGGYNA
jgi:hypothetical protein